ncbi:MAG TPA: hypothetical protein PKE26_06025 [Kiritimatiellia bacterium]|nr:hypothetical protein [Kiritimatiellia bacterium]HMO98651.1 hypothetical protein [Kiritimatiellia bacterium]HMP90846.1 hypothetical protein [Kiritimatiellia bacterium]
MLHARFIRLPLFVLLVVWLGMTGLDWVLRFRYFHWHRSFISAPAKPRFMGAHAPGSRQEFPATLGGDLAAMLTVPEAIARYGIERAPGGTLVYDAFGYPNPNLGEAAIFPVVWAGDSYLLQGRDMAALPAARLSRRLESPVYTIAHAGRGANMPLIAFMEHPWFLSHPPSVVVWSLSERDASASFLQSLAHYVDHVTASASPDREVKPPRFHWRLLTPAWLKQSLPNSSVMARAFRRTWVNLRYQVLGQINPDVVVSDVPFADHSLLFYRENIRSMSWTPEERDVPAMRQILTRINETYFRPRGILWVMLLMPEKEQVYRDWLPVAVREGPKPLYPSIFESLAPALREAGICVVNPLPVFREAAARGELLYWPDDTHWNEAGMELAADVIAEAIRGCVPD